MTFPLAVCDHETHRVLKSDDERWYRYTAPLGVQADQGHGALELRQCTVCQSTLARRLKGDAS